MLTADRTQVLMYHGIDEGAGSVKSKYCITPARFAAHMHHLADRGYRAVSIDALVQWLAGGPPLREGQFVLTFDDGFLGVRDHALPVLEKLGWPFAVFLVTGLLGGVDTWKRNDGTTGGTQPLLSVDDILDMRHRGASFHSHTRSHVSLPSLDDVTLEAELGVSRATLLSLLGQGDAYLAYPYGHVDARVEAATRAAGYMAAFSVESGFNRREVNPFRIRRIDVFGTDTPNMLLRKMQLGSNDGRLRTATLYYVRRLLGRPAARAA